MRHVYRLKDADVLPHVLTLTALLDALATAPDGIDPAVFTLLSEAQTQAANAGFAGELDTKKVCVTLGPGRLTSSGTGILALYWIDEAVTWVVSTIPLPYLGPTEADKPDAPRLPTPARFTSMAEFLAEVSQKLGGPRVPNLPDLHALLEGHFLDSPIVNRLRQKEDEVQMGVLDWDDFCVDARAIIEAGTHP